MSINVVSDAEWMKARLELFDEETRLKKLKIELAKKRRALPWRRISQDYVFQGEQGKKKLSDLFGKTSVLVVYHLMFGTFGDGKACPRCTAILDQLQSLKLHVQAAGLATFVIITKGPYEETRNAIASNQWIWDLYSAADGTFAEEFGVRKPGSLPGAEGKYNFVANFPGLEDMPGLSFFKKGTDDVVYHTYSMYSPSVYDIVQYHTIFDYMPEEEPEGPRIMNWHDSSGESIPLPMGFLKHKDEYDFPEGVFYRRDPEHGNIIKCCNTM